MITLSENIIKAWKGKKVYMALFMDVSGALNNMHHERLTHNLRKRRISMTIARWISSFLQDRSTQLQFNGTMQCEYVQIEIMTRIEYELPAISARSIYSVLRVSQIYSKSKIMTTKHRA